MILEAILTALLLGWALKGRFSRLADARINYAWMIFVPLGLAIAAILLNRSHAVPFSSPIFGAVHILGLVTWIVFAAANTSIPGAKLILAGLVVNLIAVAANGGTMPVSYGGVVIAYGKQGAEHWMAVFPQVKDMLIDHTTRLWLLCDVVPVPRPFAMGFVYSVGDIITSVGGFIAIVALMRSPSRSERKGVEGAA
jgi:hypothetical protein